MPPYGRIGRSHRPCWTRHPSRCCRRRRCRRRRPSPRWSPPPPPAGRQATPPTTPPTPHPTSPSRCPSSPTANTTTASVVSSNGSFLGENREKTNIICGEGRQRRATGTGNGGGGTTGGGRKEALMENDACEALCTSILCQRTKRIAQRGAKSRKEMCVNYFVSVLLA